MEFDLTAKHIKGFPATHFIDHSVCILTGLKKSLLTFIGEKSQCEVTEGMQDHKDFRKLMDDMVFILYALMGIVTDWDDYQKLLVFGCYFGGHQYHMCVMHIIM